jgi:hypothetical protein
MPTDRTPKNARAQALAKRRAAALLKRRKALFLAEFEASHLVTAAAKAADVQRSTVYEWRAGDEAFAREWAEVEERSIELLELEAYRRAHDGVEKPVFQGGEEVGVVQEYSDTLLIFLLKARRPGVYREHYHHEHTGPQGGPIAAEILTVDAKEASDAAHQFLARIAGPAA